MDHGAVSDRRLRIVFVGPLPPPSRGAENFSAQILSELVQRGHSVDAIVPIAQPDLDSAALGSELHPELNITRFVMPYVEVGDIPPPLEYRQREASVISELLTDALERGRPDILIAGREGVAPHLAGADGLRRLVIIHGTKMWGVSRGTVPPELAEPLLDALRRFDLILTPGRHTQRAMAALGVPGVQVIPNPVDTHRFRPFRPSPQVRGELGIDDGEVMILHASKLTEQKRPMDIVAAAEMALAGDDRLQFVIAGDGRCREEVERECNTRGLSEHFRFLGSVTHDRMPGLLNAADMVVMPSAFECQALVYLETQACGRALIASDIPAAREVVKDNVNGLLHPEGDHRALAGAILACARDPALRDRLGRQGVAAARRHSLPLIADAYEQTLTELAFGVTPSSA